MTSQMKTKPRPSNEAMPFNVVQWKFGIRPVTVIATSRTGRERVRVIYPMNRRPSFVMG